jgi:hypothetical protein
MSRESIAKTIMEMVELEVTTGVCDEVSEKEVAEELIGCLIYKYGLHEIRFFPNNITALNNVAHSVLDAFRMEHTKMSLDKLTGVFNKCMKDGFYEDIANKGDYRGHLPPLET